MTALANALENAADDTEEDIPNPHLTIRLSAEAIRAALPTQPNPQRAKTSVPLSTLFLFPAHSDSTTNVIDFFWNGGVTGLNREMDVLDILCRSGEDSSGTAGVDSHNTAPLDM